MEISAAQEACRLPLPPRLAEPGRNCWRIAQSERLGVVVDGADYFRALRQALTAARSSILILGWEFDSRTRLIRDGEPAWPNEIGPLLDHLVRTRPGLTARVLIWDSALIYAFSRELGGLVKMDWLTHRRLRFRLDDSHPLGASHHQKVVVIDDAVAFVGGLDITSQRWDTRAHLADDPRRTDPAFPVYPPFHDVMAVVAGDSARALGDLVRLRWRQGTGETVRPGPVGQAEAVWPASVPVLMRQVPVAIARTAAAWDGEPPVREVEQLYLDMIASARRFLYMENQYFASRRIAQALAARLSSADCPEMVLVCPGDQVSLMERSTMGVARARLLRQLSQADRHGRLRLFFPSAEGRDVKVHAKLSIVDDRLLRIGSANLNNRSMGLDSECDLLVEADGDGAVAAAIRAVRHDLLAEHMGTTPGRVAEEEARTGGLLTAIEALSGGRRTLSPLDEREPAEIVRLIADSPLPDPEEPLETLVWLDRAMPGPARRGVQVRVWALALLLLSMTALAVVWRWGPPDAGVVLRPLVAAVLAVRADPPPFPLMLGGFVLAGLVRLPISLAVMAAAAMLGVWDGLFTSVAGALASAILTYGFGRVLGRARVRRLAGWKVNRVQRALARNGMLAIALLRLMPAAAFTVVNLVAGAAALGWRDFVAGTVLGMAPGLFAMCVVGERLAVVLGTPSAGNVAVLALTAGLVAAAQFGIAGRLGRAHVRSPFSSGGRS